MTERTLQMVMQGRFGELMAGDMFAKNGRVCVKLFTKCPEGNAVTLGGDYPGFFLTFDSDDVVELYHQYVFEADNR